ncbi:hypothetical protein OWR29_22950 [Actinoplanes sp. Pm04-4]|uniref:Lipoprotein n=1 Tax=Paractinoplanes pyxinae TaxID=2997416 RepID=A0ABT4B2Z1_9ACTN|nr:hypothetical protein [Actinoplanes pyxinae]MCY1140867.1 hypothetical protein [Actinoplanes pyxinae]
MRRSPALVTLAMLVSGCAATQPEASIAQSGIVGCADQAVWGSVVAVTDGRATNAWEAAGRRHDPRCDDNPHG